MSENPHIVMLSPKRWISPKEFQDEFGISTVTQKCYRKSGLPYSKRGKFIFYDRNKINQWFEAGEMK